MTALSELPVEPATQRRLAVRGGIWSAASQLLPALGTAALSVAAGRYLGSGPLGRQSLIAYVNAASSAIVVISLNTALLQLGGRLQGQGDVRRLRSLTRWAVGAHLLSGMMVLAVMLGSATLVGRDGSAWAILGAVAVLDAAADGLAVRLILAEGWAPIGRLRLIFQLIGPPLGIVFLFAGYGIPGIFFGDGLAAVGLLVVVIRRYRRVGWSPSVASVPLASEPVRPGPGHELVGRIRPPVRVARTYGMFALGALITQVVGKRVEFIVLAVFSTDVAIGMYSVAFMAVNLLAMIPLGVAAAAMPLVAAAEGRGEVGVATRHLRYALRLGTVVSVPAVALLAALGPTTVTLVYGTAYGSAARLVPFAAAGLLVAVVSGVCTQFWSGQGRLGVVVQAGLLAAVADLGVAFALIPTFGATGAVAANLAGQLALAAALVRATVRRTGAIGWRPRGLLSAFAAALAGVAAALAVQWLANRLLPDADATRSAIVLVVGGPLLVLVFLIVARFAKLFSDDEADWLRPLVPRRLHGLLRALTAAKPERAELPHSSEHSTTTLPDDMDRADPEL